MEESNLLRNLIDNVSDSIFIKDTRSRFVAVNISHVRVLGAEGPDEVVGKTDFDFFPQELAAQYYADEQKILRSGRPLIGREDLVVDRSGESSWLLTTKTPLRDSEGKIVGLTGISRDITRRKRTEEALRESEERFRQFFEQSVDTLIVHDEEGRILDCNAEACRTLGYTREELLSLRIRDIANGLLSEEEKREREKAGGTLWQRAIRGEPGTFGVTHYGEHKRKDGTTFPIEVHVGGVDFNGRRAILASVRDITERREAERRLEESEQRYRSLFEHNPDAVYSLDLEGNFLTANAACEKVTGYTVGELLQMSFKPLIVPEDLERTRQGFEKAAGGEPQHYEVAITRKDGRRVELSVTNVTITVAGEIVGVYGIAKDVTARKRAEEALRESEQRYRSLVELSPDAVVVHSEGEIVYVNTAAAALLGASGPEELTGRKALDFVHPDYRETVKARIKRVLEGEPASLLEEKYIRIDGSVLDVEVAGAPVHYRGKPAVQAVLRDITDRKRGEEARARLAAIVESTDDAILSNTLEGIITSWNPGAEKLYGYSADEVLGKHISILFPPERRSEVSRVLEGSGRKGDINNYETVRMAKDGRRIHVSVTASPVRDSSGNIIGTSGILRDITDRKKAEEDLRQSEERYRAVVERTADGIYIYDFRTKRILESNTALQHMLGYSSEELLERPVYDLIAHSREAIARNGRRIIEERSVFLGERRYRRKDGSLIYVESSATVIPHEGKEAVCTIVRDITRRRQAEEKLRRSEVRNKAILETTPDLTFVYNREGEYLDIQANDPGKLYLPRGELLGNNLRDVLPPEVAGPFLRKITRTLDTGEMQVYEYRLNVPEGALSFEARMVVSGPNEVLCAVRDITERKALEQRLEHQAFHDSLTGLPNRALFMDRLRHALARTDRHGASLAVLFLDLDNFKVINDSLGHAIGDQLLVKVAHRLKTCLRPEDTVARLGGDEFIVLVEALERVDGATLVAERIAEALQAPFALDGHEAFTTASIGIALGTSRRDTPDGLLRNADYAMYRAKEQGKANYEVFDPSMSPRALERLKLENDLKRAIEREEFVVHYQPKIELSTGEIVGVEALVRWDHPERGLVSPDEFIPLAEETGLIIPIGNWVLETACRQARAWQEQHNSTSSLMLCVNLSARQVRYPRLTQEVIRIVQETGIDPRNLDLEVTESVAMKEEETTSARLAELKQLGIELAIDDFGTGYSSLSYLKHLPVDTLKIDKTFVWGVGEDHADTMLVSTMIELAHALGLKTVAEGVETAGQLERLRKMGCDMAQGNYLMRAFTSEEMSALIENGLPVA